MSQFNYMYQSKRWKAIRNEQLAKEPLCRYCKARGNIEPATVCDHVVPHRGDWKVFWEGPFQSLCKACHDSDKQAEDRGGEARKLIGLDGWPVGYGEGAPQKLKKR